MTLFSYILTHDSGFAPNPFHGCCTLACCKPAIRRVAQPGDWVVGLGRGGNTIVYAMKVFRKMTFAEYWRAYPKKRPRWFSTDDRLRVGDNIYKPLKDGNFEQLPSCHSHPNGRPKPASMKHDLGGEYVLIGRPFVYFGANAVPRPPQLKFLVVGRGHRSNFDEKQVAAFVRWVRDQHRGRRGPPSKPLPARTSPRSCGCA